MKKSLDTGLNTSESSLATELKETYRRIDAAEASCRDFCKAVCDYTLALDLAATKLKDAKKTLQDYYKWIDELYSKDKL